MKHYILYLCFHCMSCICAIIACCEVVTWNIQCMHKPTLVHNFQNVVAYSECHQFVYFINKDKMLLCRCLFKLKFTSWDKSLTWTLQIYNAIVLFSQSQGKSTSKIIFWFSLMDSFMSNSIKFILYTRRRSNKMS